VDTTVCLGVRLTSDGSWASHIAEITARSSRLLRFSARALADATPNVRLTAYKQLVRVILDYASAAWDPHEVTYIDSIESVQRKAARLVTKDFSRDVCMTKVLDNLGLQTLSERRKEHRLHLFYSLRKGDTVLDTANILLPPDYKGHNDHSLKVKLIQSSNNYTRFSYFHRTIFEWNKLPHTTVLSTSLDSFKNKLISTRPEVLCDRHKARV